MVAVPGLKAILIRAATYGSLQNYFNDFGTLTGSGIYMMTAREFACATCGQCCANQDLIQLTSYELFRLAGFLNMTPAGFCDRYCVIGGTSLNPMVHVHIRTTDMRCPFLDGKLCSVHEARPNACRAYPRRQLHAKAGDMKAFVRSKYSMLEATCSLFAMADEDGLDGDLDLLTEQAIAYMADEIYFNTIKPGTVDLAVPCDVAGSLISDGIARTTVASCLADSSRCGSIEDSTLPGFAAVLLQARTWHAQVSFVRQPSEIAVQENERIGAFLLAKTDSLSVEALRSLVESGRMDLGRSFIDVRDGKARISAVYGSSADAVAIGFLIEVDEDVIRRLTDNDSKPFYAFFLPEDGSSTKAVGVAVGR